jgi:hypothetical protein
MTDSPEKIWAMPNIDGKWRNGRCTDEHHKINNLTAPFLLEYTRSDIADNLQEVARLKAAHGKLWIALADIIECPGAHPNATVRRMAAYAEKALVHDTIADVHPVPRFYKIEVNT